MKVKAAPPQLVRKAVQQRSDKVISPKGWLSTPGSRLYIVQVLLELARIFFCKITDVLPTDAAGGVEMYSVC